MLGADNALQRHSFPRSSLFCTYVVFTSSSLRRQTFSSTDEQAEVEEDHPPRSFWSARLKLSRFVASALSG